MEEMTYKVYVRLDDTGRIIAINSSAFLPDTEGWTLIDEGSGDKFHHAQGNYFEQPIMDDREIYRYKLVNGVPVKRTNEEMDADYVPPVQQPTADERMTEIESALIELADLVAGGGT